MMPTSENSTEKLVRRAEERVLGTKFCFSCQRHRPLEGGKAVVRPRTKIWRCAECAAKQNPTGFNSVIRRAA